MKRAVPFILCILLLCACTAAPPDEPIVIIEDPTAAPVTDVPTAEPIVDIPVTDAPGTPDDPALPLIFHAYESMEPDATTAEMFTCDLDGDGAPEPIRVALDWEADTTTIIDGERSVTLDISAMLSHVILIDLDPATPYLDLIVCIDEASDDYVTVVLHPEGDKLLAGEEHYMYCAYDADEHEVVGWERTDLLGTGEGYRYYYGEELVPATDWLVCDAPTDEEIRTNREELIEDGVLLHTVRSVPCVIDGDPAEIPADSYVVQTCFCDEQDSTQVRLEDGRIAEIVFDEPEWPHSIDGLPQTDYFDNLFFAD